MTTTEPTTPQHTRPRLFALVVGLMLAAGLMLALAACGQSDGDSSGEAAPGTPATQEEVVAAFQSAAAATGTPGAFLLVRSSAGEFTSAYGTTVAGEDSPPAADTHFRAASNTKTFTGTLILQLADEGLLSLSDPVSKYQADVPGGDQITVEMLLAMRSGLVDYTTTEAFGTEVLADPQRAWRPEELLALSFAEPPLFTPGAEVNYSNTNYVLLGLIAEQVTGVELPQLFDERLLDPLELDATVFPALTDATVPAPSSEGYGYGYADPNGTTLENVTDVNPSIAWAAGAIISTADDLANWVEALAQGALLKPETQAARLDSLETIATNPETGETTDYGQGWARLNGLLGHNGKLPGFTSYMGTDPQRGVTVVIWSNLSETPDEEATGTPADTIAEAVVPLVLGTAGSE